MLLALLAALAAAAIVARAFGVPLAGAPVLADVAALGGLAGALVAAGIAALRRRPPPRRTLAVAALASVAGAAHLAFAPPAPAVLLFVVDCLRADRLAPDKMPRAWALAQEGARFTTARSQSSWTRSAMPSLLSGRYPKDHGLYRTRPAPDRIRDDVPMLAEAFRDAGWLTAGFVEQAQLDAAFGFGRGFGRYGWHDGTATRLNARFSRWNRLFRSVPRFALVHWIDVHGPYTVKGPQPSFPTQTRTKWRATIQAVREGRVVPTAEDWARLAGLYDGEVRRWDRRFGGLVDELRANGTLDAAWVVLTADHGERFGERGGIEHMGVPDETVLAVPLVVRPPGGSPAVVVDDVVQHVDVAPTLLRAVGLAPLAGMVGRDLSPRMRGEPLAPAPTYAEEWAGKHHRVAVRDGDRKLVHEPMPRLYALPEEREVDEPEVAARLEALLAAYLADAAAPGEAARPSAGTMEALEALGYLEDDP